jgi:penicillin-binding protein 1A
MTAAYGPFVNGGRYIEPSFIDHIEYDGTVLGKDGGKRTQAMDPVTALQMRQMLESVVKKGTGQRATGLPGTTGGKTGTSDNNRDAWFVGFNGKYITGAWVGHDHNKSLGNEENGGRTAVPIWREFMAEVQTK